MAYRGTSQEFRGLSLESHFRLLENATKKLSKLLVPFSEHIKENLKEHKGSRRADCFPAPSPVQIYPTQPEPMEPSQKKLLWGQHGDIHRMIPGGIPQVQAPFYGESRGFFSCQQNGPDVYFVLATRHFAVRSNILNTAWSGSRGGRGRLSCRGLGSAIDILERENVVISDQVAMRLFVKC